MKTVIRYAGTAILKSPALYVILWNELAIRTSAAPSHILPVVFQCHFNQLLSLFHAEKQSLPGFNTLFGSNIPFTFFNIIVCCASLFKARLAHMPYGREKNAP